MPESGLARAAGLLQLSGSCWRESLGQGIVPHRAGFHPRVSRASMGEKVPAMARRASQQRHLWGHSERGWGTRGDGAEHRTDTPPPPFPTPRSEASLEHGLPPTPAPLPCIFPKDWYEAPAPPGGGGWDSASRACGAASGKSKNRGAGATPGRDHLVFLCSRSGKWPSPGASCPLAGWASSSHCWPRPSSELNGGFEFSFLNA